MKTDNYLSRTNSNEISIFLCLERSFIPLIAERWNILLRLGFKADGAFFWSDSFTLEYLHVSVSSEHWTVSGPPETHKPRISKKLGPSPLKSYNTKIYSANFSLVFTVRTLKIFEPYFRTSDFLPIVYWVKESLSAPRKSSLGFRFVELRHISTRFYFDHLLIPMYQLKILFSWDCTTDLEVTLW